MKKSVKFFKRTFSFIISAVIAASCFCACSKEEEAVIDEYSGVLTKVKLGMPMKKIIALNSGCELYYESDTQIWCVNPDTDLMELRNLIPADNQFYYVDDSLITYTFRMDKDDGENYLEAYLEEAPCLLNRETAKTYYEEKKAKLASKYSAGEEMVVSTITGTEGVDLNLDYITKITLSSFEIYLTMRLTYDTVDAVEDYYASYFSIEFKELANKTPVADGSSEE